MRAMMASIRSLTAAMLSHSARPSATIAHQAIDIGIAEQGRGLAHGYGARAKALEIEPEALQFRRRFFQPGAIFLGQLDNQRE
jgi:hypothetical protein